MAGQNTAGTEPSTSDRRMLGKRGDGRIYRNPMLRSGVRRPEPQPFPSSALRRPSMEKIVDLACGFGIDPRNLLEIRDRGALDRFQGSEMPQERTLARRADSRNFLQACFANVASSALAMRAHGKAMCFVAQALDEIQHRVARLETKRLAPGHEKCLAPGIPAR